MFLSKPLQNQPQFYRYNFRYYQPCGKCGEHCDSNETLVVYCDICEKYFHRSCAKVSKKKCLELTKNNHAFICGHKCWNAVLPLSQCDNIDFYSALYGEGDFPCGKCKRDCLDYPACICCSTCGTWDHFECSGLSAREFYFPYYFCKDACERRGLCSVLPFSMILRNELIKSNILHKCAGEPLKAQKRKRIKKKRAENPRPNKVKRVSSDHFLEISCEYLEPNSINDDFLKRDNTKLTILQNNIRSLNKNLHLVEEMFNECSQFPDILSFCETKLNDQSVIPHIEGYCFEQKNSHTSCGGVGLFISDKIEYIVRKDLDLDLPDCEDVWIEIKSDSTSYSGSDSKNKLEKLVIGSIYRHPGSQYKSFCERLCSVIEGLNQTKTKYILVGDTNIDYLKFNLATNVTNYVNSLNSVGCLMHLDKPTRVT